MADRTNLVQLRDLEADRDLRRQTVEDACATQGVLPTYRTAGYPLCEHDVHAERCRLCHGEG